MADTIQDAGRPSAFASIAGAFRRLRIEVFHRFFPSIAIKRTLTRHKERELELQILSVLVDGERTSIDVGANAGSYTAELLKLSKKVVAIEPHPRLVRLLSGFRSDKLKVIRGVASSTSGQTLELEVELVSNREADALGHVAEGPAKANTKRYSVPTVALDDFSDEDVGFVKIDVEGHEMDVLEGASRVIKKCRPIFLVEAEARHRPSAPGDVFEFFAQRGYLGFFLRQGKAHPVSEFDPAMQNESLLEGYDRRDQMPYVNNFLFVPDAETLAKKMVECEKCLRG